MKKGSVLRSLFSPAAPARGSAIPRRRTRPSPFLPGFRPIPFRPSPPPFQLPAPTASTTPHRPVSLFPSASLRQPQPPFPLTPDTRSAAPARPSAAPQNACATTPGLPQPPVRPPSHSRPPAFRPPRTLPASLSTSLQPPCRGPRSPFHSTSAPPAPCFPPSAFPSPFLF